MTLQDLINQYSNQPNVGDTPENIGECVGLIEVYTDGLGEPHTWGNAKDLLANADHAAFDVVYNTPGGVPAPGDIFCFDGNFNGNYGAGAGHTGIVVSADANTVNLFQQNDPKGSRPHIKAYSYNHAIGWLHPKNYKGDNVTNFTPEQVNILMQIAQNRPATEDEKAVYPGRDATQVLQSILNSDGSKTFRTEAANFEAEQAALSAANQQINDLKAQLATQSSDTSNLNAFGSALRWLIARLGLK